MTRATRLFGDDELRVLWLTARRQELALSADGLWLRSGRRQVELVWGELEQIQAATPFGGGDRCLRLEVFSRTGRVLTVGPFWAEEVRRWLDAAVGAAKAHGAVVRPLHGADGFALETAPSEPDLPPSSAWWH